MTFAFEGTTHMTFELEGTTQTLLDEIAEPKAIRSDEMTDWGVVNKAIMERWSRSALIYIKTLAWKILEGKP